MTQKEAYDLALDFSTYLDMVRNKEHHSDSADVANSATEMVVSIIKRCKAVRLQMIEMDNSDAFEELGIDAWPV